MNDAPEMLAVIGATIIDGNGGTPIDDGVILIDGKQIIAVGDRSTQVPTSAKRIEASGKFAIPGLMNGAVFLVDGTFPTTLIRYEGRYDEVAIEAAQIALKNGLTTVFDIWGPRDSLIKARNAINQGRVTGSRIYLAGNVVGWGGPYSDDLRPQFKAAVPNAFATRIDSLWEQNVGQKLTWMSPEEVRQEIRDYVHSGIDFLHYAVTVHRLGAMQYIVFSPRVQRVIVEEAHRAGLPVLGFPPATEEGLILELNAGVDILLVSGMSANISSETVSLITQRQIPCGLSLFNMEDIEWYRQREKTSVSGNSSLNREIEDRNNRALLDAGVVALLMYSGGVYSAETSSDWKDLQPPHGRTFTFGETHFHWLRATQEKGMKPMAALMAATRSIARAYKVDKNLGTLEKGKFADLVLLDRNPLEDAENYRSISFVMKEGKIIDRDVLPTQRLLTAPSVEWNAT